MGVAAGDQRERASASAAADRGRRRERPDLVVLDMMLPDMTGQDVAAALRREHGSGVPILVVSADARAQQKAQAVGAYDVVQKPFGLITLLRAIEAGLNHQQR
jgi:DNA-binding response OmpR family regulator